jgi:plastocyanin
MVAALGLALGLGACGDDDTQTLDISASGSKKAPEITAPESIDPGVTEITLDNQSEATVGAQLLRVEGDHSAREVLAGLGAASSGKPFPNWFFGGGGTPGVPAGESATVTQNLLPGTYYVFNDQIQGGPDPDDLIAIDVTGEESDSEIPETDATVAAIDYGFEFDGDLQAGGQEITFDNTGGQPHHMIANRVRNDATADEVQRFLTTEKGKPPFVGEADDVTTAVLEGGDSQTVTVDFPQAGKYAFFCFISDRQGGPPHVVKGMVDVASVGSG